MSFDRPTRQAPSSSLHSVPTPRSGVPTSGFGVSELSAREPVDGPVVEEPLRRSRAVTIAGALLVVVAVAAAVVAFRIMVPSTPTADAAVPAATRSQETREQPGSVVRFGDPYTYGDGLEVAVNAPLRYEPSDNATGIDQGVPTRFQVVVTNRTDQAFRPNTLQVSATSAGQAAVAVWDPDQGVGLTGPDVSIPAGATIQFFVAFAVQDPADVALEITPALFGYGPMQVRAA